MSASEPTIATSDWIGPLSDGNTHGYIDRDGKWALTVPYPRIGEFHDGLAAFVHEGKLGFFDIRGVELIKPIFDSERFALPQFYEGLAPVYLNGEATFVDKCGNVVVSPRPGTCYWNFVQGKALVSSNSEFTVINRDWEKLSTLNVQDIPFFYQFPQDWNSIGCFVVVNGDFRSAYINWKGEFIFPPIYSSLGTFVDGVAAFAPSDQFGPWGLVRESGDVIVPPTFHSIGHFSEGLAPAAMEKKKIGYINSSGDWIIPPIYQQALAFSEGLACVTVPGKHRHGTKGFINPAGEMVIEPRFFRQSSFRNGWAYIECNGMNQVIDRTGRVLWETPVTPI